MGKPSLTVTSKNVTIKVVTKAMIVENKAANLAAF
jgi:hypothetical protein